MIISYTITNLITHRIKTNSDKYVKLRSFKILSVSKNKQYLETTEGFSQFCSWGA